MPLIGAILGLCLALYILLSKGAHKNNKGAKITLSVIVLLNAHNLIDYYLFFHKYDWSGLGLAYLHYHLVGALFLLYTYYLFKVEINLKLWGSVIVAYTLLRWAVLLPFEVDFSEDYSSAITSEDIGWMIDYLISILLNIVLLFFAFLKINKLKFAVDLNAKERLNYLWLKNLLIIAIVIYLAVLLNNIITLFDLEKWLFYGKIESVIFSLFFFAIAFCAIRFPVFSVYGDFEDLSPDAKKKYANSSLKATESDELWAQITKVIEEEKAYRNPKFRLNDLAERTGKSLHHISQVINQKQGMSFSDFVNQYRVQEAQDLLRSSRAEEITILAIALEVGFNSKTAFYNSFKKLTGKTPSDFKRELKGEE